MRAPLAWLGLPDPAAAVFTSMTQDPDRETLARLLEAWVQHFKDDATSSREVVELAEKRSVFGVAEKPELAEVVREIAEERGVINRRRFGRWVARHQGRVVAGRKIERDSQRNGAERWRVVSVVRGGSVVSAKHAAQTVRTQSENPAADVEVF